MNAIEILKSKLNQLEIRQAEALENIRGYEGNLATAKELAEDRAESITSIRQAIQLLEGSDTE